MNCTGARHQDNLSVTGISVMEEISELPQVPSCSILQGMALPKCSVTGFLQI